MKTTLKIGITVKDICEGFVYNELEGKGNPTLATIEKIAQALGVTSDELLK